MDPLIGQTLDGRYKVLSHLGEGGMGAVYKAMHVAMEQPVAIKVLLTESANDPSMVKRFIREARSCFRINHPNCVRVTDFGASATGELYFAMEYLDGRTLGIDLHVDGPMGNARVRHIAAQVADALQHAHGLGLIHRDLKPANIMLVQRDGDVDFVKVFDFGLGKLVDEGAQLTGLTMSPLTQKGIVFGTPEYMSPEQARGEPLGPASDIYTLGVCCYEMLTETLPFEGKTFTEILSKHVREAPIPPSQRFPELSIEPQLEALVLRCLSKDARVRPSATELSQALRHPPADQPTPAPTLTSSETLLLSEASMAALPGSGRPIAAPAARPQLPRRRLAPLAIAVVCVLSALGFFVVRTVKETAPAAIEPAVASPPLAAVDAAVAQAIMAESILDASPVDSGPVDSGPALVDASPKTAPPRRQVTERGGKSKVPDPHLEAAEQARKDGKWLKQLSEANASLRLHPNDRRAAFLAGEALQKSGDKVAACKFFRRAGSRHYRAAGCSD